MVDALKTWTSGTFTATGDGEEVVIDWQDKLESKGVTLDVRFPGGAVGTVHVERQFPNPDGRVYGQVGPDISADDQQVISETIRGTKYKVVCSAYTSGNINWTLGASA